MVESRVFDVIVTSTEDSCLDKVFGWCTEVCAIKWLPWIGSSMSRQINKGDLRCAQDLAKIVLEQLIPESPPSQLLQSVRLRCIFVLRSIFEFIILLTLCRDRTDIGRSEVRSVRFESGTFPLVCPKTKTLQILQCHEWHVHLRHVSWWVSRHRHRH